MTYTDTIQTITYLSGVATFYCVRSVSTNGIPTYASLKPTWPLVERIDVIAGDYEIPELEFTIEDEDTGYWLAVLAGETVEIIIDWTAGGATSRLFHGSLIPGSVHLDEYDRYTMQRRGTFRCLSVLSSLRNIPTSDVITACAGDMISLTTWDGLSTAGKIMSLKRFLVRIMEQINGTLDDDDIVVSGLDQDIQYSVDNSTWYDWHELYFWCGTQNSGILSAGWFQAEEWPRLFPSALEALVGIVKSLLALPIMYYDVANSRYRVRIVTRGRSLAGSTALVMGTVVESKLSTNIARSIRSIEAKSGWSASGTMTTKAAYYSPADDTISYTEPALGVDLSFNLFWIGATEQDNLINALFRYTSGTTAVSCVYTKLWNYVSNDWTTSANYTFAYAAKYLGDRLARRRWGYDMTHMGIGPVGADPDTLYPMKNYDIADEVPYTRHFYASEIARNPAEDVVRVNWEQI